MLLNCIIVDYFILLCHEYLFIYYILFIIYLFIYLYFYYSLSIFIFLLLLVLLLPSRFIWSCVAFVVSSRICVIVFYIVLYLYFSHVIHRAKDVAKWPTFLFYFLSRHTWKHVLFSLCFLDYYFLNGKCFKFY